ncbi:fibronectin type III domain-containing protein [Blastococcus aurantiacus]|uniref:fibronectin type III domain-containing protein n=1 Tax=Blastococcus aurantiacus TaxID=1550231 RepID=UPI000B83B520|nr:LPXTG cell wall anchor domain-containing protein [Blastococcus aurantiacus]
MAVGAIGMSTAVLGVTGTASAATTSFTFTTAASGSQTYKDLKQLEIEAASGSTCTVDWVLVGGAGGAGADASSSISGAPGGRYAVTTEVHAGDVYDLFPGKRGGAATFGQIGSGGANGSSWGYDGVDGGYDGSVYGGGGGGASLVGRHGDTALLGAFGGNGGGNTGNNGAGGLDGESLSKWAGTKMVEGPDDNTGAGSISGTVTCTTAPAAPAPEVDRPGTPTVNWISAGNKSAMMQIWAGYVPQTSSTPVYEYSLDGGAWKKLATSSGFQIEPTITGLVNGKTYSVRVRVTVDGVSSDATAGQSVTPYQPIGAPGDVAVTFGAASTTITWTAPAPVAGVPAVDGYDVGFSGGEYGDNLCTTAATVLTCTVTDTDWFPGSTYTFSVTALDAAGNRGESGRVEAVAPFPATVPTSDGPLTNAGSSTSLDPGQSITISGTGYMPFSTVTVVVYSSPTVLGTAEADENGAFTFTGTLPEGLAAGSHTLVAAGVDADGNPYHLTQAITVAGGTGLPNTGASVTLPALGGLTALAMGGGLLFAARRRTTA